MIYVLVVITVFNITGALTTETRFQEFDSREACETAKVGIAEAIASFEGPMGRKVFVACYPKG